jgi:hypothetical protein
MCVRVCITITITIAITITITIAIAIAITITITVTITERPLAYRLLREEHHRLHAPQRTARARHL